MFESRREEWQKWQKCHRDKKRKCAVTGLMWWGWCGPSPASVLTHRHKDTIGKSQLLNSHSASQSWNITWILFWIGTNTIAKALKWHGRWQRQENGTVMGPGWLNVELSLRVSGRTRAPSQILMTSHCAGNFYAIFFTEIAPALTHLQLLEGVVRQIFPSFYWSLYKSPASHWLI